MKVIVILEVDVDKDAYNREYSRDLSATDIRYEIRQDILDTVRNRFDYIGHAVKEINLRNP